MYKLTEMKRSEGKKGVCEGMKHKGRYKQEFTRGSREVQETWDCSWINKGLCDWSLGMLAKY